MIRVLVADDQPLVRRAITGILQDVSDIKVIAEAVNGEEALKLARTHKPDVILMDIEMPGIGGLEATRKLLRNNRDSKIIIVTAFCTSILSSRLLKIGALGYLTKDCGSEEMITAIRKVALGERYLSANIASEMAVANLINGGHSPFTKLSDREIQILLMLVRGVSGRVISKQLFLSPKTVSSYRHSIFRKLDVHSDVEMTIMAIKHGLVHVPVVEETVQE